MLLDTFTRTYSDRDYRHTALVRHQGKVVAFALDASRQMYYTVLQLDGTAETSPFDVNNWFREPRALRFPNELAEVGVGLADQTLFPVVRKGSRNPVSANEVVREEEIDTFLSTTARLTALSPFQAMSDGQHIYLFRQALAAGDADMVYRTVDSDTEVPLVDSTLLVDRFLLVGSELHSKMEVRFQRSRSKTRPQSQKDSLGARDMNENPFYEPTQELRFVGRLTEGRFYAMLLPTEVVGVQRWQIFAYDAARDTLESYNVERSEDGLFNTLGSLPVLMDGYAESAFEFTNTQSYIQIEPPVPLPRTFTQEAWIYPTDGAETALLLGSISNAASSAPFIELNQRTALRVGFGNGTERHFNSTGHVLSAGWNHIAVTFDGNAYRIYVNGQQRMHATDAQVSRGDAIEDVRWSDVTRSSEALNVIGSLTAASFMGKVDEIRLWDYVRTPDQINADMNRRLRGDEAGLAAYWRMDEAHGRSIYDNSENHYHGTVHGAMKWVTSDAPIGIDSGLIRSSIQFDGRSIASGMNALLYHAQEIAGGGTRTGEEKPLKRSPRVMLAVATAADAGDEQRFAVLDFGVSGHGILAQTPDVLGLPVVNKPDTDDGSTTIEAQITRASELGSTVARLQTDVVNLQADLEMVNTISENIRRALNNQDFVIDFETTNYPQELDALKNYREALDNEAEKRTIRDRFYHDQQNAKVTVYEHDMFGGASLSFGLLSNRRENWITYTYLNNRRFNDRITSLRVPPGLVLTIFEHANFNRGEEGKTRFFSTGDVRNLKSIGWNDKISSMIVRPSKHFTEDVDADYTQALENTEARKTALHTVYTGLSQKRNDKVRELATSLRELEMYRAEYADLRSLLQSGVKVTMQTIFVDSMGLTVNGGLLDFAWSETTPSFFESATGKIAMYFRGTTDQFFAVYYDTFTERARYRLANEENSEAVICWPRSTEPEMDGLMISLNSGESDDDNDGLCTVTITSSNEINGVQVEETWRNVPRNPERFARVLNGQANDRSYLGHAIPKGSAGHIRELRFEAGVRRKLDAGDTLVMGETRLRVVEQAVRGATSVSVTTTATAVSAGPAFYIEYDYLRNASTTRIPARLDHGSLLVRANSGESLLPLSLDLNTEVTSAKTISSQWTAALPGYTLAFDGDSTSAVLAASAADAVEKLAAPGDIAMEAWLRPDQLNTGIGAVVTHRSAESRYGFGLLSAEQRTALLLEGNQYAVTQNHDALNFDGQITMEAWVYPMSRQGRQYLLCHRVEPSSPWSSDIPRPQAFREIFLQINDGQFQVGLAESTSEDAKIDPSTLAQTSIRDEDMNRWVHLAGTYDGSHWRLYRNGEQVASSERVSVSIAINAPWGIGGFDTSVSARQHLYHGAIDQIRIWTRARTGDEITQTLYQMLGGLETDLAAYLYMDGGRLSDHARHSITADHYNSASKPVVTPDDYASPLIAYRAYAVACDKTAQSQPFPSRNQWTHIAAVYNQSYGLQFDRSGYLNCGNDATLDISYDLTIEVFFRPSAGDSRPHALVSKGRLQDGTDDRVPYCLYIDKGKLCFAFEDVDNATRVLQSEQEVVPGIFARYAVVRKQITPVGETVEESQPYDEICMYKDGRQIYKSSPIKKSAGSSAHPVEIGRTFIHGLGEMLCNGIISEVRIWSRALPVNNLGVEIKGGETGLVSWWRFEENEGTIAYDSKSTNHGRFSGRVTWVKNPDLQASKFRLYRNGVVMPLSRVPDDILPELTDDNLAEQFTLGAQDTGTEMKNRFQGQMEELRVWKTPRTQEQIQDNLFTRLVGEKENILAYYTFDAEDRDHLLDSGYGGHSLRVNQPLYVLSTAPVGEEIPLVRSALAGIRTPFNGLISSPPGVVEYGDLQYDIDGNLIGVLKRCYSYLHQGQWHLITGFKVGNLVTEWVAQVQTNPHLIGFIEGAPPVPSENLTGTGLILGEFSDYNQASSVEITAAEKVDYSYASSRDRGIAMSIESKIGGIIGAEASAGIGLVVKSVDVENIIGAVLQFESNLGWLDEASRSVGLSTTRVSRMTLRGGVENAGEIGFPEVGRRFLPENVGFALVQSETFDIFALRLAHNNALISYQGRPNPDIPKDWNIITFPINPRYTLQGSLDGKVGLRPDPNYPNAMTYSPDSSYFKPIEAYSLKNRIQREEERLRSQYNTFEAGLIGRATRGNIATARLADELPKVEKRNLVNTYVWTADGGLFAETQETLDILRESTGGSYSMRGMAGVYTDLTIAVGGVGLKFELDALFGGTLNIEATKAVESENSFGIEVDLSGVEGDLYIYNDDGTIEMEQDESGRRRFKRRPGKVDAYRFMTFYLEPNVNHFDHFFSQVIDPIWLAQSSDPNANALRQAQQVDKKPECWRVMHRVTFVSRILPDLANTYTPLEEKMRALDIESNYELIKLLEPFVAHKATDFAEFSKAVYDTLRTYHTELVPHGPAIVRYMSLYYGIDGETSSTDPDTLPELDSGVPLDMRVSISSSAAELGITEQIDMKGKLSNPTQALEVLYIAWTKVDGPGQVAFSHPNELQTNATFTEGGVYRLRLTVSDGVITAEDDLRVTVNRRPVISAGGDLSLLPDENALLSGAILDNGLGDSERLDTLVVEWTKVIGPGTVAFSSADGSVPGTNSLMTEASFSRSGRYLLRLSVRNASYVAQDEIEVSVAERVIRGLQMLYIFGEGRGETVNDVSRVGEPLPLTITQPVRATWNATNSLTITEPNVLISTEAPVRLTEAIRTSNALTVELWITPARETQPDLARLLALSGGHGRFNLVVGQRGGDYYAALRTAINEDGSGQAFVAGEAVQKALTHLVLTRDADGNASFYINGKLSSQRQIMGALGNWDLHFPLLLGGERRRGSTIDRAWTGTYHLVALYDRTLSYTEVEQNFRFGADTPLAPVVSAGEKQTLLWTPLQNEVQLEGSVYWNETEEPRLFNWTQIDGPEGVIFADNTAQSTVVRFNKEGRYVLRLMVSQGDLTGSDVVIVVVHRAPTVDAGPSPVVLLGEKALLHAEIASSGLAGDGANSQVKVRWEQDGTEPAVAVIDNPDNLRTQVTLPAAGMYTFSVTVDNGLLPPVTAMVPVYVNEMPVIRATAPPIIRYPETAHVIGHVDKLGLVDPQGSASFQWRLVSGTGEVSFAAPNAMETDVQFSRNGVYELAFSVQLSSSDADNPYTITAEASVVIVVNRAPIVYAGQSMEGTVGLPLELEGLIMDDGLPNPPGITDVQWSKVDGPGIVRFDNERHAMTRAQFDQPGKYTLQLAATDYTGATPQIGTLQVMIKEPPALSVLALVLVNSQTRQDLEILEDGAVIDLKAVGGRINIRAVTFPAGNGSVVFQVNGVKQPVENSAPYLLAGNSGSNYNDWNVTPGTYTLSATMYERGGGTGTAGQPLTISVTFR